MHDKPQIGTVSRHLLRRTAREREQELQVGWPLLSFTVESTIRGPFGWRVVRYR